MYTHQQTSRKLGRGKRVLTAFMAVVLLAGIGVLAWIFVPTLLQPTTAELLDEHLSASQSLDPKITENIRSFALEKNIRLKSALNVSSRYTVDKPEAKRLMSVLVPVTELYSDVRDIQAPFKDDEGIITDFEDKPIEGVTFIEATDLTPEVVLLSVDGEYYLDTFSSGAVYEELVIDGELASKFNDFSTNYTPLSRDTVFSMHTTGVTALTREMMKDLNAGVTPTYFSEKIGEFLSSADITHVSNEVSFKEGCTYSATLFCSPPEFIATLKASGVDVVELTGNHNNDVGSEFNTSTIELYSELGWAHVGGGRNDEDASTPYIVEKDDTTFGMLAYNYPDAPNGGAISGPDKAGANAYTTEKMKSDVLALKEKVDFVQVNIQFWECYAYPNGYVEFPECDYPIGEQEAVFKSVIDAGADMVVGSSAHQPQTYEQYNDGWIYYGLGNLYFDQDRWPGTERGLVLTNYFFGGKLIQTRITPTVYGGDFQPRVMTNEESQYLLGRLNDAR